MTTALRGQKPTPAGTDATHSSNAGDDAMHKQDLIGAERTLLADLERLVAERAKAEESVAAFRRDAAAEAERTFQTRRTELAAKFDAERDADQAELERQREALGDRLADEISSVENEYEDTCERMSTEIANLEDAAKKEYDEAIWQTGTLHEAEKNRPQQVLDDFTKQLKAASERLEELQQQVQMLLRENRKYGDFAKAVPLPAANAFADPFRGLQENLLVAEQQLGQMATLQLPRFFQQDKARAQFTAVYQPLVQALTDAAAAIPAAQKLAQGTFERLKYEVEARRQQGLQRAEDRLRRKTNEVKARREWVVGQTEGKYPPLLAELARKREAALQQLDAEFKRKRAEKTAAFESRFASLRVEFDRRQAEVATQHEGDFGAMSAAWQQGLMAMLSSLSQINEAGERLFPGFDHASWKQWKTPTEFASLLRFGKFHVDPTKLPGGVPQDPRLCEVGLPNFSLPAAVPFPDAASFSFAGENEGRDQAVLALQALMLRLLVSVPPGKLRFTVIDPVGLGQNFGAFMHLADYDELLVNSRIWTEQGHIEQRLADLTDQMETIIQKYLRNEFRTIAEYNVQAGEVAEPLRFLVVANFPVNFTEAAARRLVSIAASGPRCGVHTLVTVDRNKPLPHGFQLRDLYAASTVLSWEADHWVWKGSPFEKHRLELDPPPSDEFTTRVLKQVGEGARLAGRVEVPFDKVAPPQSEWWKGSTAKGVGVPVGPAGATKLQHVRLGSGTSQHVLVAGKTGSGKSTLLHVLITNLALHYSPDEVELYLVDFKKGVEFKTYAAHELPHARVIAIESEREFGLSVLERLDVELKARGDRFRDLGVQDLNGFRQEAPNEVLPRVLLIVDEFQEIFTEDDRISQGAALLLDRLVRQGRAFGMHVLLGSQTLGGAYSLARSTVGQMAVRIALQCSEADAHLILSEDNSAARLLTRPGEAIYNDAGGLLEGNHPFQVAWLSDELRDKYLQKVTALTKERKVVRKTQIVFEGTQPADIQKNPLLSELLARDTRPAPKTSAHAWLGDAVAIKDPTAAVFRRQSGSNLLVVGQQEGAATAIFAAAVVGLAAQQPGARFFVFETGAAEGPAAGSLSRLGEVVPHFTASTPRDVPRVLGELTKELERRVAEGTEGAPPWYLFVFDLPRFRDLRKKEDDYSFSKSDAPPDPSKQLVSILRDGPSSGIHTSIWCDTLNNVNRAFDRQTLREFEMRVLFQMSPTDSSHLIDNPAASKLGINRALFHSEEEGRLEKFRPYGPLPDEWLQGVTARLRGK